jgi:microcystin-dependent protein
MTVLLSPVGNGVTFLDSVGLPLVGGKIYTYQAGSTTPLDTYTTVNGNIANPNPIILGTDGRAPDEIWLTYGYNYKFVIKTAGDVTIQTLDNLYGILQTAPTSAPVVPSGCIILWSGASGSIPATYYLCDGNNGTPDLRNRFIVGAGDSYSVNQTGGSADSIVVSHTHTATVTDPGHTHTVTVANQSRAVDRTSGGDNTPTVNSTSLTTNSNTTGVSVAISTTGTSGTNTNLPPYYALCYIMKA